MKYLKNYNTFILENKHTYNSKKFKNLIGLNISEIIDGDFACSNNFNLKSLEGAPKVINGNFDCNYNNELENLKGSPETIYGYCSFTYNKKLTSLEGSPKNIIRSFKINNNSLKSLEGCPKNIGGFIDCSDNELTSLKGAPKKITSSFDCNNNELTSLEGAPTEVGENLYCYYNKLTTLDYLPEYIGGKLYCYYNDFIKPISYKIMDKYNLHCLINDGNDKFWVYKQHQFDKFSSFEYQKEFLEREPENYLDLKPIGYAKGIEELFPHLFDMDELGLID